MEGKNTTIYVRTFAYNAEKTLRRAVDSVLNQTYIHFVYYLLDNGSTDDTQSIINEYAAKDSRIVPFYTEENMSFGPEHDAFLTLTNSIPNDDLFCVLDADDEYEVAFFERAIQFMEQHHLDIVCCGSDFLSVAQNNKWVGQRALQNDLILEGNRFADYFPSYHAFMRTVWGKLLKGYCAKNFVTQNNPDDNSLPGYGIDTWNILSSLKQANRVGIMSGTMHKYYISPKSVSYILSSKRIISDKLIHEATVDYLQRYGPINQLNCDFLFLVYLNAIKDTLHVVLNAQIPLLEKMQNIREVVTCEYSCELFSRNFANYDNNAKELRGELRGTILNFLLTQKECRKEEGAEIAAEIIASMHGDLLQIVSQDGLKYIISKMPEMVGCLIEKDYNRILERLRTWFKRHDVDIPALTELEISAYHALGKSDEEIVMPLISIRKNKPQASSALDIDAQICKIIEKYPLLKNMNANLASAFPYTIRWVMKEIYKQALDAFISVQDVEINDNDAERYILFGQNLSAAAENADAYIYFKKVWISYLLDCSRSEEAKHELDEFELLLPDDEEFIELRNRLTNG